MSTRFFSCISFLWRDKSFTIFRKCLIWASFYCSSCTWQHVLTSSREREKTAGSCLTTEVLRPKSPPLIYILTKSTSWQQRWPRSATVTTVQWNVLSMTQLTTWSWSPSFSSRPSSPSLSFKHPCSHLSSTSRWAPCSKRPASTHKTSCCESSRLWDDSGTMQPVDKMPRLRQTVRCVNPCPSSFTTKSWTTLWQRLATLATPLSCKSPIMQSCLPPYSRNSSQCASAESKAGSAISSGSWTRKRWRPDQSLIASYRA